MTEPQIAETIKSYWAARGYAVEVKVGVVPAEIYGSRSYPMPAVRSNLIGGLPPGYQDLTASEIAARAG